MNKKDKKILLGMGFLFLVFATIISKLITGTWLGLLMFVGYVLYWAEPFLMGIGTDDTETLENTIAEQNKELAILHSQIKTQ